LRKFLLVLICALMLPTVANGAETFEKVATVGAQFLKIGAGARAVGMGEAFVAVASDLTATYWNPAGLRYVPAGGFYAGHSTWIGGTSHDYVVFAFTQTFLPGIMAISFTSLTMDSMTENDPLHQGGTGRSFDAGDVAVGMTYSRILTDRFTAGGTVRWFHSGLAGDSGEGIVADFGTLYDTKFHGMQIGIALQNMGPHFKYLEEETPVPITFRFGLSAVPFENDYHRGIVAVEFKHPNDSDEKFNFGFEYGYKEMFFGRVGYKVNYDEEGLTAGAGARLPFIGRRDIAVNYCFQEFGRFPDVHRVDVSILF